MGVSEPQLLVEHRARAGTHGELRRTNPAARFARRQLLGGDPGEHDLGQGDRVRRGDERGRRVEQGTAGAARLVERAGIQQAAAGCAREHLSDGVARQRLGTGTSEGPGGKAVEAVLRQRSERLALEARQACLSCGHGWQCATPQRVRSLLARACLGPGAKRSRRVHGFVADGLGLRELGHHRHRSPRGSRTVCNLASRAVVHRARPTRASAPSRARARLLGTPGTASTGGEHCPDHETLDRVVGPVIAPRASEPPSNPQPSGLDDRASAVVLDRVPARAIRRASSLAGTVRDGAAAMRAGPPRRPRRWRTSSTVGRPRVPAPPAIAAEGR
jgi:hypothetical protein